MLTGQRLFTGETVSHVLASVLKTDPNWALLRADTPPALQRLLRRSLERERKRRLPDAAVALLEIEEALTTPVQPDPTAQPAPTARWATGRSRWHSARCRRRCRCARLPQSSPSPPLTLWRAQSGESRTSLRAQHRSGPCSCARKWQRPYRVLSCSPSSRPGAPERDALGLQPEPNPTPNLLALGDAVPFTDASQPGRQILVDPEVPHLAGRHRLIVNNIVYERNPTRTPSTRAHKPNLLHV